MPEPAAPIELSEDGSGVDGVTRDEPKPDPRRLVVASIVMAVTLVLAGSAVGLTHGRSADNELDAAGTIPGSTSTESGLSGPSSVPPTDQSTATNASTTTSSTAASSDPGATIASTPTPSQGPTTTIASGPTPSSTIAAATTSLPGGSSRTSIPTSSTSTTLPPGAHVTPVEKIDRATFHTTLDLSSTTLAAGSSITGRVIVQNDSGEVLYVNSCDTLFAVGLNNGVYYQMIAFPGCWHVDTVPEGNSSWPVTVTANYTGCTADGFPSPVLPACLPDGRWPPLPPGTYMTTLDGEGVPADAPPIEVTVT